MYNSHHSQVLSHKMTNIFIAINCSWPEIVEILKTYLLHHWLALEILCFYSYCNKVIRVGYGNMDISEVSYFQSQLLWKPLLQFSEEFAGSHLPDCIYHNQNSLNSLFKIYRKLRADRMIWGIRVTSFRIPWLMRSRQKFDLGKTSGHSSDPFILKAYILLRWTSLRSTLE